MGITTRSVVSAAKSVSNKKKFAKEKKKRDATWQSAAVGSGSSARKANVKKQLKGPGGRFDKKVPAPAPVEAEDVVNVDTTLEATDDLQEISNAGYHIYHAHDMPSRVQSN